MTGYCECEAGWEESLVPEGFRFALVRGGRALIETEESSYEAEAGDLILFPAGIAYKLNHLSGQLTVRWCQFRANLAESKLFELLQLPLIVQVERAGDVEVLLRRMAIAEQEQALTSRLKLKAALLELISCYLDHCKLDDSSLSSLEPFAKLGPVLDYIEANLDRTVGVEELAGIAFMHPNYFIELFRSLIGESPIHYVNRRKLEYAKRRLEKTEEQVAQIASRIGMQNHYLSRMFRQYCGLSPSQYRKKYRAADKWRPSQPTEKARDLT
ncbi:helix-turn-helix domain-containing protein [Paenibacillus sp. 1P07SE]|uniref:AraC family transcriptional regulator n=1 Tax=Paenibacillus sp. 1P07SE TaxID=3132209 RepID=UPI0039A41E44